MSAWSGDPARPVAVVATGGTIASVGQHPDDLTSYMASGERLDAHQLVGAVRDAVPVPLVPVDLGSVGGPDVSAADWLRMLAALDDLVADVRGLVLTHGTNALEETALFLRLAWRHDVPLVMTGAMRPSSARSPDGPANLVAAVRTAASPRACGRGVMVTIDTTVLDARHVTKASGDSLAAFTGGEHGPAGFVELDGTVHFVAPPFRVPPVDLTAATTLPRVDVLPTHVGADDTLVAALVEAGTAAIVLAGSGSGFPTRRQAAALHRAHEDGIVVCRTSRTGAGGVLPHPWYPGWLAGGRLTPWQARTALAVTLAATRDPEQLQRRLDTLQWAA